MRVLIKGWIEREREGGMFVGECFLLHRDCSSYYLYMSLCAFMDVLLCTSLLLSSPVPPHTRD